MLVGYGMLAMSESRALIALLSIGLERSARIHFRSLHEYAFRAEHFLADAAKAHSFKISAAREMKRFLDVFGISETDPRVVAARARYLADADADEQPKKERDALGGDMAALMRARFGNDARYLTTFGQPSLFSHGSILALYEVSEATNNKGDDFIAYLVADGQTPLMLLACATQVLTLSFQMMKHFGVDVIDEWDALKARIDTLGRLEV